VRESAPSARPRRGRLPERCRRPERDGGVPCGFAGTTAKDLPRLASALLVCLFVFRPLSTAPVGLRRRRCARTRTALC
jgi:hypothetical protein